MVRAASPFHLAGYKVYLSEEQWADNYSQNHNGKVLRLAIFKDA